MDVRNSINWGISNVYTNLHLPSNVFNILQASDEESSLIAIAHFLDAGLKNNEKVALISFDNPQATQQLFQQFGFNFNAALNSEDFFTCTIYLTFPRRSVSPRITGNYSKK